MARKKKERKKKTNSIGVSTLKRSMESLCPTLYSYLSNVAVEIVANGFAKATEHRSGDLRSKDYEDILKAENLAIKSHRGIHTSDEKAAITYINDATSVF